MGKKGQKSSEHTNQHVNTLVTTDIMLTDQKLLC